MNKTRRDLAANAGSDTWQRLVDVCVEDILSMSDEEIRAEFVAMGLDPDEEAAKVKQIIDSALEAAERPE